MHRYLVMRKEGLVDGPLKQTLNSSFFPVLVETDYAADVESVVREAFRIRGWANYSGINKSYLVFKVGEAKIVRFVPKATYDTIIEDW